MNFLNSKEINAWLNLSMRYSGYHSINRDIIEIWKELVFKGLKGLPVGLVASLIEFITYKKVGLKLDKLEVNLESDLIARITASKNIELLQGEFFLSENLPKEKIIIILELILERFEAFSNVNFMLLEKVLEEALADTESNFENEFLLNLLTQLYQDLLKETYQIKVFIDNYDFFEIKNQELFNNSLQIKSLYKKMIDFSSLLKLTLIGDLTLPPEQDSIVLKYGEPVVLPLGGFDALTNRGDFSSLLPSELVFIDKEEKLDYFDYKYLQNELLYYKREEGLVFRIRRSFTFLLEITSELEHESNLAIVFAFYLELLNKLSSTFSKDITEVHIVIYGYQPTSINYALKFFEHFIKEQNFDKNTFIYRQNSIKSLEKVSKKDSFQQWLIGSEKVFNSNFIAFKFPSFDILKEKTLRERAMLLANQINYITEEVVSYAYRSNNR